MPREACAPAAAKEGNVGQSFSIHVGQAAAQAAVEGGGGGGGGGVEEDIEERFEEDEG